MPSILDYLNTISDARYGRDVRQAIVDAISACYQDGRAGVSDLEARRLIESAIGVNESQQADIDTLYAQVAELQEGGGESSQESTTITLDTVIFDGGFVDSVTVNNNATKTYDVTFTQTFTEVPEVFACVAVQNSAAASYSKVTVGIVKAQTTKTGFRFFIANTSGATRSTTVVWAAFQPTTKEIDLDITIPSGDGMSEADVLAITNPIQSSLNGIKTGYDGTVYSTPGEAVREQINDLHVLIGDEPGTAIQGGSVSYDGTESGLTATTVQAAIDENAANLSSTNERLDSGVKAISSLSPFQRGGMNTSSGNPTTSGYLYRVVSTNIIEFAEDVTLTIADGFRIAYMIFVSGEPSSFKSWFTGEKTFTAGQTVRMMIARTTEDTSEQADVEEFTEAVTFPYSGDVARRITFVENGMTALASDYTNLSATVEENTANIMNLSPKKQEDGYVYSPFIYPLTFDNDFKPVTVFYDGHEYFTDYKKENFRNSDGTSVIHVSPNGSASASGATEEASTTLTHAISLASANSRILLHEGFYLLTESEYRITKQLDLIGSGNVYLCFNTTVASPSLDNVTGLYTFASTGTFAKAVVKNDLRIILTKKDTLADCQLAPYSWYAGDGTVYFNLPYSMEILMLSERSRGLTMQNTSAVGSEVKVYIENVTFIGARDTLYTSQYPGRILYLVTDNVKILHALGTSIHVNGGKCLANKTFCIYGNGDGFQYQVGRDDSNNPEPTLFMEIDCIGANLGTEGTADSINGTTAHDVDKGIRVNGKYYNNMGGNCTDIGNTTQTVNLGCEADNSCGNAHKEGFSVQSTLTQMWLYNCSAKGNDADLQSQTGCFIYTHNCDFTTRRGNGTVEEIAYP